MTYTNTDFVIIRIRLYIWCPNCKRNLRYAGGRIRLAVICNTSGCVSRFKGTYETIVTDAIKKELIKRAADLAQRIEVEEPPEAEALRQQISKLEAFDDADLEDAIEAKKEKFLLPFAHFYTAR